MTLENWTAANGILPTHPTTERGAVSIVGDYTQPAWRDLWHLTDYVVSSACGSVLWLLPRDWSEFDWSAAMAAGC